GGSELHASHRPRARHRRLAHPRRQRRRAQLLRHRGGHRRERSTTDGADPERGDRPDRTRDPVGSSRRRSDLRTRPRRQARRRHHPEPHLRREAGGISRTRVPLPDHRWGHHGLVGGMITGRDTLSQLQRALQDEQKRTRALDAQMSKANDRLLQLDATRSKELQQLARVRLQHLGGGAIEQRLDDADRQVMALLEERTADYNALQQRLTALEQQRDDLERERDAAAEAVERAAKAIDDAEVATQARLRADPEYQRALQRAREAERVAVHADEKATLSEQEQDAKGKAYRDDPLFMYLWKRRYGTSEYRAGGGPFAPLLRWLDGKVARLISYADARPNYARLLEIPLRLREHAEYVGAIADAELE